MSEHDDERRVTTLGIGPLECDNDAQWNTVAVRLAPGTYILTEAIEITGRAIHAVGGGFDYTPPAEDEEEEDL